MSGDMGRVLDTLKRVTTDSVWWILNDLGFADTYIPGLQVLRPDLRMAGRAVTLRFLPIRRDLQDRVARERDVAAHIQAADESQPGDILVAEMGGEMGAGFIGDVIVARFQARGGAGIVADGATRDVTVLKEMGIPIYVGGGHAAASWRRVVAVDLNVPIRCAGVSVLPGDILLGDAQGVIAIPEALAEEVAERAVELEDLENYVKQRLVDTDVPIREIYPPTDAVRAAFRAQRGKRE